MSCNLYFSRMHSCIMDFQVCLITKQSGTARQMPRMPGMPNIPAERNRREKGLLKSPSILYMYIFIYLYQASKMLNTSFVHAYQSKINARIDHLDTTVEIE